MALMCSIYDFGLLSLAKQHSLSVGRVFSKDMNFILVCYIYNAWQDH